MRTKELVKEKKNIVILGAGFAGIRAALDLDNYLGDQDEYDIILVDRKDYHLYNSALYEAATTEHGLLEAKKVKRAVTVPLGKIFNKKRVKLFKAYIDKINLEDGMVVTDSRILNYTYLVVAMGSIADFYGIPNLEKHGFTLKSLEDAIMIRNRVEDIVTKKDKARIVIGGAGYTGAEFCGELMNLIKHECVHHNKDINNYEVLIVEGSTGFLPGLPENISKIVGDRLTKLGVKSRFSTLITEAGSNFVMLNNKERIDCDLLIWTGGVRSCRLPADTDLDRDKKDRTAVSEFLNLKKFPNVFVIGDNGCIVDPISKKPVLQTATEAIHQGKVAAKNIFRMAKARPLHVYYPRPARFIVPVAGKFAVFYAKDLLISGKLGWAIRKLADLRYFWSILPFWTALNYWMFENRMFIKND